MPVPRPLRPLAVVVVLALTCAAPARGDVVAARHGAWEVLTVRDGAAPVLVTRNGTDPSWSADRRTLAYVRRDGRVVLVRDGRRSLLRAWTRDAGGVVLSPAGDRLLVGDDDGWRALDLATGTVRPVTRDPYAAPRFSPDGRSVAWSSFSHPYRAYVRAVDRTARARPLPFGGEEPVAVAWLGAELAVLHGELGVARRLSAFDPATGVVRPLPGAPSADAVHLGATFGGRLLTVATVTESRDIGQITVLDVAGAGRALRTIAWTRGVLSEDVAFSQDGRELYVTEFPHLLALDLATGARRVVARNVDRIGAS